MCTFQEMLEWWPGCDLPRKVKLQWSMWRTTLSTWTTGDPKRQKTEASEVAMRREAEKAADLQQQLQATISLYKREMSLRKKYHNKLCQLRGCYSCMQSMVWGLGRVIHCCYACILHYSTGWPMLYQSSLFSFASFCSFLLLLTLLLANSLCISFFQVSTTKSHCVLLNGFTNTELYSRYSLAPPFTN